MWEWQREQANDKREAREADATAYRDLLRLEAENATLLSALKAMDEALMGDFPSGPKVAYAEQNISLQYRDAWTQIRSAITSADAR